MSSDPLRARDGWRRVEEIYWRVADADPASRTAVLDEACAGDGAVRRAVERLLARESQTGAFLETNALAVAADLLSGPVDAEVIGQRFGPYEVRGWIGSGGMGDVFRAHDEQLGRDVALKLLPAALAGDADRLARFTREAQILASLNHPNIAAIYGFEQRDGVRALVLELADGPTLADLVSRGPLGLDDTVFLSLQIAAALEAAHERGIVHRDLKPSNVAVLADRTVKLLDFGIATVLQTDAPVQPPGVTPSCTPASIPPLSSIAGTPAYASPEQVRQRLTDKRTDVWAFGAVMFEMLTGRVLFHGRTPPDIMAAVLQQEIDWALLPPSTPLPVRRLLQRCLERDVSRRLRDIGEARIALEPLVGVGRVDLPVARPSVATRPSRTPWLTLGALGLVTLGAGAVWMVRSPAAPPAVTRLAYVLPGGQSVGLPAPRHAIALSRDGRKLAYVAEGRLYARTMSELEAQPVRGTEEHVGLSEPVFAPDGESIAFWTPLDRSIKRIGLDGGSATSIAKTDAPFGMTWTADGILFGQGRGGILRAAADGSGASPIVQVAPHEQAHGPQLLPGGRFVLYTVATGDAWDRWEKANVYVQAVGSNERARVIEGGSDARYLPTGHLVYVRDGTLFAVPFDLDRRLVRGTAVALVEGIRRGAGRDTGASQFALSDTGTLAYVPGPVVGPEWGPQQLGLADRAGRWRPLDLPPAGYRSVAAAPDGSRIALAIENGNETHVFIYDIAGSSRPRQLTFAGVNRHPVWTADGLQVSFQSNRNGDLAVFRQLADGTGTPERLTTPAAGESHAPESWSPDGRTLLFSSSVGTDVTLRILSLDSGRVVPFGDVRSARPVGARFSPDGGWVVYTRADRDMPSSIFVEPFPPTGVRHRLSVTGRGEAGGAHKPLWSRDGRELFYVPRLGGFEAAPVITRPVFAFGAAVPVKRPFSPGAPNYRALFDVLPEGGFVGLNPVGDSSPIYTAPAIQLVLNWFEEVKARVR
jgi:hypothetical protein